jgi:hypothetical protein
METGMRGLLLVLFALGAMAGGAVAGEADVLKVEASPDGVGGRHSFGVTVQHADTGWEHYADKWDVVAPDGKTVLGTRVLLHPHSPAPFTRSLSGVKIPPGITEVILRAHDKVHGYGGKEVRVELRQ